MLHAIHHRDYWGWMLEIARSVCEAIKQLIDLEAPVFW